MSTYGAKDVECECVPAHPREGMSQGRIEVVTLYTVSYLRRCGPDLAAPSPLGEVAEARTRAPAPDTSAIRKEQHPN